MLPSLIHLNYVIIIVLLFKLHFVCCVYTLVHVSGYTHLPWHIYGGWGLVLFPPLRALGSNPGRVSLGSTHLHLLAHLASPHYCLSRASFPASSCYCPFLLPRYPNVPHIWQKCRLSDAHPTNTAGILQVSGSQTSNIHILVWEMPPAHLPHSASGALCPLEPAEGQEAHNHGQGFPDEQSGRWRCTGFCSLHREHE